MRRNDGILIILCFVASLGLVITSIVIMWHYIGSLAMMRDSLWILVHEGHAGIAWLCAILDVFAGILFGVAKALVK